MVMPKLATKIGLNESMFLQQVHYWNEINKVANNNYKDGYHWTFNSVSEWQEQFPFWSRNTIQRTITNLEKMKLIVTGNYNKLKIDRTKWYRIDYDVVEALETSPFTQIGTSNIPEWIEHITKLGLPLPEINSETNAETNIKRYTITSNGDYLLIYYNEAYKNNFGKEHPTVTKDQLISINNKLTETKIELDLFDDQIERCIDFHFDNLPQNNDGKIFGFIGQGGRQSPIFRYNDYI